MTKPKSEVSDARLQELYDRTPVMMHSIDDQGRLVSVNGYWLEVLGYQRDEVLGRPSTDFLTDESRRYAQEVTLPEFRRTGVAEDIEYQMVRRDGDVIDVLLSATASHDAEGQLRYTTAQMVDEELRLVLAGLLGVSWHEIVVQWREHVLAAGSER